MTLNEICVINRALDGEDIYSLPSFRSLHMTEPLAAVVKQKLIRDGLLTSTSSFSDKGIRTAARIKEFKKAKVYIQIGPLVLGYSNGTTCVLLKRFPGADEYGFECISCKNLYNELTKAYPFILLDCEESASEEMPFEQVMKGYSLDIKNGFRLVISEPFKENHPLSSDELYFVYDKKLYIYNCRTEKLSAVSGRQFRSLLQERMRITNG